MRYRCLIVALILLGVGSVAATAQPIATPQSLAASSELYVSALWSRILTHLGVSTISGGGEAGGTFEPDGEPTPSEESESGGGFDSIGETLSTETDVGGTFEPDGSS